MLCIAGTILLTYMLVFGQWIMFDGKRGLSLTWGLWPVRIILKFCSSYNSNSPGKLFTLTGNNLSHRHVLSARDHKVVFDVLIIIFIILRFLYFCHSELSGFKEYVLWIHRLLFSNLLARASQICLLCILFFVQKNWKRLSDTQFS